MSSTREHITATTYRLLETIPYPRGERMGRLHDASGTRLHGAYERKVAGGYQSALINNGHVIARYVYGQPAPATVPGDRHSYANLVHCGGYYWEVPADSNPPVSSEPATEHVPGGFRGIWDDHFVQQRLLANLKPAGCVSGSPEQVHAWCAEAEAAGLTTRTVRSWTSPLGDTRVLADIARRGPVLIGAERQDLYASYYGLVPDDVLNDALDTLEGMTGEDFLLRDWANPVTDEDYITTGHALGYPPMSTVSVINFTNTSW